MAEIGFFDQPDTVRKLALEVEGKRFWVSRETLALWSPVFKALLYGDFAEADQEAVKLPDKKADEIEELLLCLLPSPEIKKVTYANLELLLSLAEEYQIKDIRKRAEEFFRQQLAECGQSNEKLLYILRVSAKFHLKDLLFPAIKRCAAEFSFQKLHPLVPELPVEVAAALLYACVVPLNRICRYSYTCGDAAVCCNTNNGLRSITNRFMKCTLCAKKYCGQCVNNGKLQDAKCSTNVDVENNIRAFLDRIQ